MLTYEELKAIIKSVVYKTVLLYPDVEWDELEGEGWLIVTEDVEKFDAGRGVKLSTYLYSRLEGRLSDYTRRNLLKHQNMNGYRDHGTHHEHVTEGFEDMMIARMTLEQLEEEYLGTTIGDIIHLMKGGYTQSEVSRELGITRQAVSQALQIVRRDHE